MNNLKRTLAIILCLLLALTCLAGCHQKGEIAVKISDYEFTSGYYACALVFADGEARTLVEEQLSEDGDLPEEIKYWNYKVEDTDYVEWVQSRTLKILKELAALKTACAKAGIELSEDEIAEVKSNADFMWDGISEYYANYGYAYSDYSDLLMPNGVSYETYEQYMIDSYLYDKYFEYLYGKGGEKEIPAEKITTQLTDNYVLVNIIQVDYSSLTDEEKTNKLNQLTAYKDAISSGAKSFEEVYLEYNGISAEDHTHEEAEEGETLPQDQHATVLGAEDTDYTSDYYESAKAMEVGAVTVATLEDDAGIALIVKKDIAADPYYLEQFDSTLRTEIAGEEFEEFVSEAGAKLECEVNTSSTKQFKVKKIVYPED